MTHVVVLSTSEVDEVISGTLHFIIRFYKKRPDFLGKFQSGDLIYFRKSRGEILGQFEAGKLVIIEGIEKGDWDFIKMIGGSLKLKKEECMKKLEENKILVIIQINKLEQFITPPIEINKRSRREWVVLS